MSYAGWRDSFSDFVHEEYDEHKDEIKEKAKEKAKEKGEEYVMNKVKDHLSDDEINQFHDAMYIPIIHDKVQDALDWAAHDEVEIDAD